jgi:hypothetical protein
MALLMQFVEPITGVRFSGMSLIGDEVPKNCLGHQQYYILMICETHYSLFQLTPKLLNLF